MSESVEEPLRVLDVGSGVPSRWHKHVDGENIVHMDVSRKAHHLESQCTVYHLPFQTDSFDVIYCSHVLEHLLRPVEALSEMHRVTRKHVIIKVPNASYFKCRPSGRHSHLYSWNEWTLKSLLRQVFPKVSLEKTTRWRFTELPTNRQMKRVLWVFERTLFGLPELTAICHKKRMRDV